MSIYKNMLDNMVWSFSRINSYDYCPYSWYLRYIEKNNGVGSFYADNGKAVHEVLELITNGTISVYDAPMTYLEKYENILNRTKESSMEKTFESCMNYLSELDESVLDGYKIIGSELKINYKIGKYNFIGFIDLLLEDKNGNYIVVDHKSADPFLKKNGEPYSATKTAYEGYVKQLYLYSEGVKQAYGKYPTKLVFNHFKAGGKRTVINWNKDECDMAKKWAVDTIKRIYKDKKFDAITKTGFCYRLCAHRYDCVYTWDDEEE